MILLHGSLLKSKFISCSFASLQPWWLVPTKFFIFCKFQFSFLLFHCDFCFMGTLLVPDTLFLFFGFGSTFLLANYSKKFPLSIFCSWIIYPFREICLLCCKFRCFLHPHALTHSLTVCVSHWVLNTVFWLLTSSFNYCCLFG